MAVLVAGGEDRGRRATDLGSQRSSATVMVGLWIQECQFGVPYKYHNMVSTYPAMPMDCGNWSVAIKAWRYTALILSIPSRVPTRMSVGVNVFPSGFATARKLSSYTSGRSPVEKTRRDVSFAFARALPPCQLHRPVSDVHCWAICRTA